jgi:hypothetical protein
MRPEPSDLRARRRATRRPVRRAVLAALAAAVAGVAVLGGCGSIGDAQQVVDRARLVNDFAERLSHAGDLTYTAEYQLPDGATARIAQAQHPFRAAYTYPGGKFVITPERIADCRTGAATTCTLTAPPSAGTDPTTSLLGAVDQSGLVPPAVVVGLLTAASLSTNAVIKQHDTTVGGEHATCVEADGVENAAASAFTACLTVAGVLGSFSGTVDGTGVAISLTRYQDSVAEDAFDLPPGAQVVDERPGR